MYKAPEVEPAISCRGSDLEGMKMLLSRSSVGTRVIYAWGVWCIGGQ